MSAKLNGAIEFFVNENIVKQYFFFSQKAVFQGNVSLWLNILNKYVPLNICRCLI